MEIIRRDTEQPLSAITPWEPSRWMRDLIRWDPFQNFTPFASLVERPLMAFQPNFDVRETKEAYVVKADLPGLKEDNLELSVHGNRLQVTGKREEEKEEKTETYYTSERSFGAFTRVFTLPDDADADKIKAELKDGVLTVHVAKSPDAQTKRIPVKASKS